ncbi:MAG: hypothetical protein JXA09_14760 [Anaerolineae bacterium]|nr:hypothetical protein [Anaerolineae bacterium]
MDSAAQERIGEIVETETSRFVAESFELHRPPALGQLVYVETDGTARVYGVVCHGTTASPDPGRRAVRRSTSDVFDSAIYREHPQLELALRTEFQARLVGYGDQAHCYHYLPPQPPPLHYSVHTCSQDQVVRFTEQLTYMRLLLDPGEIAPEQLLAAHIRGVHALRGGDRRWLDRAAREVASLLKSDYDRLMTVLYGIDPPA